MKHESHIFSRQDHVRDHLLGGFDLIRRLVAPAYGPAGRVVMLDRARGTPGALRSGAAIAGAVREQGLPGVVLLAEAMEALDRDMANGASTLALLAEGFARAFRLSIAAGLPEREAAEILENFADAAARHIEAQAVTTDAFLDECVLKNTIIPGDPLTDSILAAHTDLQGAGGLVVDQAAAPRDEVLVQRGYEVTGGWADASLAPENGKPLDVRNPFILVLRGEVSDLSPIVPVLNQFVRNKRNLVIVADALRGDALAMLYANRDNPDAVVTAIKGPGHGEWRLPLLEDLAEYCGAHVIAQELGRGLDGLSPSHLGQSEGMTITNGFALLRGGRGDAGAIERRKAAIRADIAAQRYLAFDRIEHQKRLSRFGAGLATIRLCKGHAFNERRRAAEAAVSALRLAAGSGGVLVNGAAALLHVPPANAVADHVAQNFARQLHRVLTVPMSTILSSCGLEARDALKPLLAQPEQGYDSHTCTHSSQGGAMPAAVMARAIRDAASVAAAVMSVGTLVQRQSVRNP